MHRRERKRRGGKKTQSSLNCHEPGKHITPITASSLDMAVRTFWPL